MPPRPFIFSRETERAAIDRAIRDPAKRQALYEIVDAVLRVNQTGLVTQADLAPVAAGFEFTAESVWSRAASWLAKLHAFDPAVIVALDDLSRHTSDTVRLNLCRSLDRFPKPVTLPLLQRLLDDNSAKVRHAALGVAMLKNVVEFLPALRTRRAGRISAAESRSLDEAIAWLERKSHKLDGVEVRQLPNGDIESEVS
jgi:hypothetical protein